jgi:hypothetical protein
LFELAGGFDGQSSSSNHGKNSDDDVPSFNKHEKKN